MYRGSSPIFDVPEFPPLRRVKPLPKRRRTSTDLTTTTPEASQYAHVEGTIAGDDAPVDMASFGLNMPLPQYYLPIFNGVQDLFHMGTDERPLEYPGGFAVPVGTTDEEDHGDGDYVDHLQQPGNTKKRKVPAAHHSAVDALPSLTAVGDDDADERGQSVAITGRNDVDEVSGVGLPTIANTAPLFLQRRNRSSPATLAGLQHKELLKTRKRQLAAVLGALSHGDTLALDQALSARYSTIASGQLKTEGKENDFERKLRRRSGRHKFFDRKFLPAPNPSTIVVPTCEFIFVCPSPTSERLISTREEVAVLHSRFEAELSRQASKAAELAKQNALASAENTSATKRGERTQQRSRALATPTAPNSNNGSETPSGTGTKSRNSKKKKRSVLANASNPHHLRNYVPSRLPHSGPPPTNQVVNLQNLVSPPPVRFLSAEIAPRRRQKTAATTTLPSLPPLNHPEDEWICAFCEYNLFYGDDSEFRRAVRSRKKILGRRRRARERAAAAASGQKSAAAAAVETTTTATATTDSFDSHVEEYAAGDVDLNGVKRGTLSKRDRDKQGL